MILLECVTQGYNLLDIHFHTKDSYDVNGIYKYEEMWEVLQVAGIKLIVKTDHDNVELDIYKN